MSAKRGQAKGGGTKQVVNRALTLDWLAGHATGKGIDVAVIDSGVDASHPRLRRRVTRACVVSAGPDGSIRCREVDPCKAYDSFGHGTGVAGIIAEIAPEAKIVSVKVLDERNGCGGHVLVAGMKWALDQGIPILNMSLASSRRQFAAPLLELCEQAYVQNALIVAAKRNVGDLGYPAMFSSVISVDRQDFAEKLAIRFRPRDLIEYEARGILVRVPAPGGGYTRLSGTSFATPHVTGLVALIRETIPDATSFEVKTILKALSV